eukprot:scaffold2751_cov131-Cylindrotheca_fusiformis.AAC.33
MQIPKALTETNPVTILGYGALLSEDSARLTFPHLSSFRLVRLHCMRRVFSHPHLFLLAQDLIDPSESSCLASLSTEPCPNEPEVGFVAAAFDVELDEEQRRAFVEREGEYDMQTCPYYPLDKPKEANELAGHGLICVARCNDDSLPSLLDAGRSRLNALGKTVWNWEPGSGLRPADMYLRHCLLAVKKAGPAAEQSFLNDTYLIDRSTTLSKYLRKDGNLERVMNAKPPERLKRRFNG